MNLKPVANIYRRLPPSVKKKLIKFYRYVPYHHRVVVTEIDGIKYELDLARYIDASLYYYGVYEPLTVKIFEKFLKHGMTVFDIGSNSGPHTLRIAKLIGLTGTVYAFEPMSEAFRKLIRNIELNNFHNIIPENIGLSNVEEEKEVYFTFYGPLDGVQPEHKKEKVHFFRLDDYVERVGIEKVDFIKIDVDGYEYKVLTGGEQTLRENMPKMVIEVGFGYQERFGDTLDDLLDFLYSLGYSFFTEKLKKIRDKKELLTVLPKKGATNMFCMKEGEHG